MKIFDAIFRFRWKIFEGVEGLAFFDFLVNLLDDLHGIWKIWYLKHKKSTVKFEMANVND